MRKTEKSQAGFYFLLIVLVLYVFAGWYDLTAVAGALKFSLSILTKVLPILLIVFLLMVVTNRLVQTEDLLKWFTRRKLRSWMLSSLAGILSMGPIYMWYPLLNDLQKKGVKNGFIATFLYGRAIKPALMPLMAVYFGWTYVLVLSFIMFIFSIITGIIVDLVEVKL
jgi:uncharacterized membrane protein YraQ (UPF0718 family)